MLGDLTGGMKTAGGGGGGGGSSAAAAALARRISLGAGEWTKVWHNGRLRIPPAGPIFGSSMNIVRKVAVPNMPALEAFYRELSEDTSFGCCGSLFVVEYFGLQESPPQHTGKVDHGRRCRGAGRRLGSASSLCPH